MKDGCLRGGWVLGRTSRRVAPAAAAAAGSARRRLPCGRREKGSPWGRPRAEEKKEQISLKFQF